MNAPKDDDQEDTKTKLTDEQNAVADSAIYIPIHKRSANDWKAVAFYHVERDEYEEALEAFQQEATRRSDDGRRTMAEYHQGITYNKLSQPQKAIDIYETLIAWGKGSDVVDIQERVARAWVNLGGTYTLDIEGWVKQPKKRLEACEALIAWGKDSDVVGVPEQVAMAWVNLGSTYTLDIEGWVKQPEKEVEAYKALIAWGKDSDVVGVQERVSGAYANISFSLFERFPENPKWDEAIKWADEGLAKFKGGEYDSAVFPDVQACIGGMMNHKAQALYRKGKCEDVGPALKLAKETVEYLKDVDTDFARGNSKEVTERVIDKIEPPKGE